VEASPVRPAETQLGLWSQPRGNGKSSLAASLGLDGFHGDDVEGAHVVVVAADERQARIVFRTAVRITELSEPLGQRTQMFQNRLYVPRTGSEFRVLPADRKRLEGVDPSLAIVDEMGWSIAGYGKWWRPHPERDRSLGLAIGTPSRTARFRDVDAPRIWARGRRPSRRATDLSLHSRSDLDAVALALNTRPRKTLGWRTPAEALDELLRSA
jgi:hypothetical protein